ncbi:MAG: Fe-S cluster assembly protein SufB, partial [Geminicoccaceae bacterium]
MATALETVEGLGGDYKYGFVTDVEAEIMAKGLSEETVRVISAKKNDPEWLTEWRLQALERFLQMEEPDWAKVEYPPIDFQDISYFAAPKSMEDRPQ